MKTAARSTRSVAGLILIGCFVLSFTGCKDEVIGNKHDSSVASNYNVRFTELVNSAPPELRRFADERAARVRAMREVQKTIVADADANADLLFGPKDITGKRNLARVCRGVEKLLSEHMAALDESVGIARTVSERNQYVQQSLIAGGCFPELNVRTSFAPDSRMLSVVADSMTGEEADLYLSQNLRPSLQTAMDAYSAYGPANFNNLVATMTELEVAVFESWACELDISYNTYNLDPPPSIESIFGIAAKACGRAAAAGCGANTLLNWHEIYNGARVGMIASGWLGAAIGGGGLAVGHCAAGAIAGWLICRYA